MGILGQREENEERVITKQMEYEVHCILNNLYPHKKGRLKYEFEKRKIKIEDSQNY